MEEVKQQGKEQSKTVGAVSIEQHNTLGSEQDNTPGGTADILNLINKEREKVRELYEGQIEAYKEMIEEQRRLTTLLTDNRKRGHDENLYEEKIKAVEAALEQLTKQNAERDQKEQERTEELQKLATKNKRLQRALQEERSKSPWDHLGAALGLGKRKSPPPMEPKKAS